MFGFIRKMLDDDDPQPRRTTRQRPAGLHTLVVQAPYCAPKRDLVIQALQRYGVKVYAIDETIARTSIKGFARMLRLNTRVSEGLVNIASGHLATAQEVTVKVSKAQAGWAEYLLWRTGKVAVVRGQVDARNEGWATRHGGKMPRAWLENARSAGLKPPAAGVPWIESTCKSADAEKWREIKKYLEKSK